MKMTRDDKIKVFEKMLRKAPEIMTPGQIIKFSPYGKHKVYQMIKDKELPSFIYQGHYIIAKTDLIEFLADNCDKKNYRHFSVKDGDEL